jgi:hypothetical protein
MNSTPLKTSKALLSVLSFQATTIFFAKLWHKKADSAETSGSKVFLFLRLKYNV